MKLKLQKINWTIWQICEEGEDLSIEIPGSLADLVTSLESAYMDLVSMVEDIVQDQHGKDKVV